MAAAIKAQNGEDRINPNPESAISKSRLSICEKTEVRNQKPGVRRQKLEYGKGRKRVEKVEGSKS
jgi:hypothetical protein